MDLYSNMFAYTYHITSALLSQRPIMPHNTV
jgi:hypothetical protein